MIFQTLNSAILKKHENQSEIIVEEFLNHIDHIKNQMIKEGSEFKNVSLKFISRTNRYEIADKNIKVKF